MGGWECGASASMNLRVIWGFSLPSNIVLGARLTLVVLGLFCCVKCRLFFGVARRGPLDQGEECEIVCRYLVDEMSQTEMPGPTTPS